MTFWNLQELAKSKGESISIWLFIFERFSDTYAYTDKLLESIQ